VRRRDIPSAAFNNRSNPRLFAAPPRFSITPEDMIYVNLGDAIILNCQAEGTPTPELLWYKDANPVEPNGRDIGIFNDGTELRLSTIKNEDIGDYTCLARNGEGQISHTARVVVAGEPLLSRRSEFVPRELEREISFPSPRQERAFRQRADIIAHAELNLFHCLVWRCAPSVAPRFCRFCATNSDTSQTLGTCFAENGLPKLPCA